MKYQTWISPDSKAIFSNQEGTIRNDGVSDGVSDGLSDGLNDGAK